MRRRPVRREPPPEINERLLKHSEVRLIDADGQQLGVMSSREAVDRARDAGLDLVLIAGNADPPVTRIADYGKYKYEQSKRNKANKPKKQEVKGIKIGPATEDHDLQVGIRNAIKFLNQGHKVRMVCRFRRRQLTNTKPGRDRLLKMVEAIGELGKVERDPALSGMEMVVVVSPNPKGSVKKDGQDQTEGKTQDEQDGSEAV